MSTTCFCYSVRGNNMTEKVTFASMNVQGLGDCLKRKDVFNYLKTKKYNIYFLQDTHFTDKDVQIIRSQWGYECYFCNYSSQSRGVGILINNNFEYKFGSLEKDNSDNLLVLHCKIKNQDFSLFCIYGPNRDDPNFYSEIKLKVSHIHHNCIIGGGTLI